MRSVTALAVRFAALVICLVGMPLVAVFWKALPESCQAIWVRWRAPARHVPLEPPKVAGIDGTQVVAGVAVRARPVDGESSLAKVARFAMAGTNPDESHLGDARSDAPLLPSPLILPDGAASAAKRVGTPLAVAPLVSAPQAEAATTNSQTLANDASARRITERLKTLGATYYRLETWGPEREIYRFHCKISAGGDAHGSRYFEASSRDAVEAMERVLRDVETWQSTRSS